MSDYSYIFTKIDIFNDFRKLGIKYRYLISKV
jgi:hypothetical protein